MYQRQTRQLIILLILFAVLVGTFLFLKLKPGSEEETKVVEETYSVIDIDEDMVNEIGITTTDGTLDLYKEENEWKSAADGSIKLDNIKVKSFLRKMCSIESETKIEEVSDFSEYGLSDPVMQVTLQWEHNLYTIKAGDYNSLINLYYISVNDETTVYAVDSTVYNAMNMTIDDFKEESTEDSTVE